LYNSSSKACPAAVTAAAAAARACRNSSSSNMERCCSQQQTPWYSVAWLHSTLAVTTQAQAALAVITAVGAAAAAASSPGFRACSAFQMQTANQQMCGYPHAACSCWSCCMLCCRSIR
jgi:hypothetical protein